MHWSWKFLAAEEAIRCCSLLSLLCCTAQYTGVFPRPGLPTCSRLMFVATILHSFRQVDIATTTLREKRAIPFIMTSTVAEVERRGVTEVTNTSSAVQ